MKLWLIRHGETEWNRLGRFLGQADVALNQRGLAQAMETAKAIAELRPAAIYSSPLTRTMQCAEAIAALVERPVRQAPLLKELSLGDLEGVTGDEMRTKWPLVYAAWRTDPALAQMPNGESLAQLQERAWQGVLNLEQAHNTGDVVAVISHNFTIRVIVAQLLGMPLTNFHRMTLGLSSITAIEHDGRGYRLLTYNSTCHLSPENR